MDIFQLIKNIRKGDIIAEKALYEFCSKRCFKIALIYCNDKAEATSVFNHAMLYVFENLDKLDKSENLIKWVTRIVKNDCIDQIRKKTVYRNKLIGFKENEKSSEQDLNLAITALAMEDIIQLINQLKPELRLCFILHSIDGYTYREIAEELAININTAKWYVAEAKKILQLQLVQLGYHPSEKKANGFKK